jgi:hypothetical protein
MTRSPRNPGRRILIWVGQCSTACVVAVDRRALLQIVVRGGSSSGGHVEMIEVDDEENVRGRWGWWWSERASDDASGARPRFLYPKIPAANWMRAHPQLCGAPRTGENEPYDGPFDVPADSGLLPIKVVGQTLHL